MKDKLTRLSRQKKQAIMISADVFFLVFAIWLSFALRLGVIWSDQMQSNLWIFVFIPLVSIPIFIN